MFDANERQVILCALEAYRKIKGAEGKLEEHKKKTREEMKEVSDKYGRLMAIIESAKGKLA